MVFVYTVENLPQGEFILQKPNSPLILALDVENIDRASAILDTLKGLPITIKVGLKLFTAYGPSILDLIKERNLDIFLDLKYHDIPNTVKNAVREATKFGVEMLTIQQVEERDDTAVKML